MKRETRAERKERAHAEHRHASRRKAGADADAAFAAMDRRAAIDFFGGRGLSRATVAALVAHGIALPEELLFMTREDIRRIPGLDDDGRAAIREYRRRFAVRSPD
jgi:hypothetical protein